MVRNNSMGSFRFIILHIFWGLTCYGMKKIFITACLALAIFLTCQYAYCVLGQKDKEGGKANGIAE